MNINTLKAAFLFIFLVLIQVWVLNNVHLLGVITPLLYVYFILKLSSGINRSWVVILSFLLGLTIDIFDNTPGLNALATTVAGFLRYYVLNLFSSREEDSYLPSARNLGLSPFMRYASVVVVIHHIILFTVESFSFYSPLMLVLKIAGSSLFTLLLILAFELFDFDILEK